MLGWEFISSNDAFLYASELLIEAADHSMGVNVSHYMVIHGVLLCLLNNSLSQHRWLCEEWGSLLGLSPHSPP